ncbi:helix-turn-helix domain-containing protein [Paenibacillus alvei]|uniref:helix-turn-helix domain-containing protein n=1 Tax=Paenibacillus alvei TaxID=44250 RepID=UPI0013DD302F|nr:helix-turn-helix transcriptional regulator [Paenibacillus alvei]NEZ44643.1 helix-turn-helix domain-containing protein [Paenibacillus alvei]
MSTLGNRINLLRKKKGLTQEDMANYLKINRATFSGYERDAIVPPSDKLNLIVKIFDTSADFLLCNTDNPLPPSQVKNDIKILLEKSNLIYFAGRELTAEERIKLLGMIEAIMWK